MTDGEPQTAVSASLQKIKSIINQHKHFLFIFYFIKSQTSDSFINHFDGHLVYLKTWTFPLTLFDLISSHLVSAGTTVRVLFMDFSSAFSTIQPHVLIKRLLALEVNADLVLRIRQFLCDRPQRVRLSSRLCDQPAHVLYIRHC